MISILNHQYSIFRSKYKLYSNINIRFSLIPIYIQFCDCNVILELAYTSCCNWKDVTAKNNEKLEKYMWWIGTVKEMFSVQLNWKTMEHTFSFNHNWNLRPHLLSLWALLHILLSSSINCINSSLYHVQIKVEINPLK